MSVKRIGEVQAKEGRIDDLREFMKSILPLIRGSEGCLSCELLQNQADTSKFLMVEVWESVEAHQASVKVIPPAKLDEIRSLLAAPPSGDYYEGID
jgi:heme oxygenase (mycobilin-producing)